MTQTWSVRPNATVKVRKNIQGTNCREPNILITKFSKQKTKR